MSEAPWQHLFHPGQRRRATAQAVGAAVDHLVAPPRRDTGGRPHDRDHPARRPPERVDAVDLDRPPAMRPRPSTRSTSSSSTTRSGSTTRPTRPTSTARSRARRRRRGDHRAVNPSSTPTTSRRRHAHGAQAGRLDGRAHRLRRGRGRGVHLGRHAVEPAGAAAGAGAAHAAGARDRTGCASSPRAEPLQRRRSPRACSGWATTPSSPCRPTRPRRMDPAALAGPSRHASPRRPVPMAVVATAGTTDRGVSTRCPDRGRVRRARRLAARRRRLRLRAAGLADAAAPARRHRARRLGHGRLPQELLPAGVVAAR